MDVGQRIREAREDLGMPQTVLARRVGVNRNTIWRYESGEHEPSFAMLQKIARELRTEPAEFLREPVPLAEAPRRAGRAATPEPGVEREYGPAPTLEHDYEGPFWRRYDAEWDKHMSEIVAAFEAAERGDIPAETALRRVRENLQPALLEAARENGERR
jgi:transcriptional regulator with XRE-family HTH domain